MGWFWTCSVYLLRVRLADVVVLQGAPLLGALFALQNVHDIRPEALVVFVIASFLLVAHVFCFNDWSDIEGDSRADTRLGRVFATREIAPRQMLIYSIILGAVGVAALALVSLRLGALAGGVVVTGVLYSHPAVGGKGTPLVSSMLHFIGQSLQFLLGYSLFAPIGGAGLMISAYFGIVFVAGHLNQETRDFEGDKENRIKTNAVTFGKRAAFFGSFALFSVSFGYLGWLAYEKVVFPEIGYLLGFYPVYVVFFLGTLKKGLHFEHLKGLQSAYRVIFALIGLGIVAIGARHLLT